MKRKTSVWISAIAGLALVLTPPLSAQSTGPSHQGYDPNAPVGRHFHEGELGEKLMVLETALKCNCSCGLDVHSCQFQMQCGVSPGWTMRIRDALEAGQSVEAIQAGFVADYGTEVLMLPPAEGFNLLGYFLPAVMILAAGMLVGLIARGGATRTAMATGDHLSDDDEQRLRAAMEKLDEEESPDW